MNKASGHADRPGRLWPTQSPACQGSSSITYRGKGKKLLSCCFQLCGSKELWLGNKLRCLLTGTRVFRGFKFAPPRTLQVILEFFRGFECGWAHPAQTETGSQTSVTRRGHYSVSLSPFQL